MIIYPAIDIKEGKVVRLLQGQFDKVTEYSQNPCIVAQKWADMGAQWLHIVDLDGAKTGKITNLSSIEEITKKLNLPIQVGGGIRNIADINALLNIGVSRIILGTTAIENLKFLKELIDTYEEKIVVSLDCDNGCLTKHGWATKSDIKATDFIKELEKINLRLLVYTDIATDGMLTGPNYIALKQLAESTTIPIIASGGISSLDDIRKLNKMESLGIVGAITGKAIYENKLNLEEALKLVNK